MSEQRIRRLLRTSLGESHTAPDGWDMFKVLAHRRYQRRRLLVAAVATLMIAGLSVLAFVMVPQLEGTEDKQVAGDTDDVQINAGAAPFSDSTVSPDGKSKAQRCNFPNLRPTYLPWAEDDIPPPIKDSVTAERVGEASFAILIWTSDPAADTTTYVHLETSTEQPARHGDEVDVFIDGAPGILGDYDSQSEGMVINWVLEDEPCRTLELALSDPALSRTQVAEEIRKIARSLSQQVKMGPRRHRGYRD